MTNKQQSTTRPDDPFHEGEREIQQRLGVRDNLSRTGKRAIRDHMIDQHRAFYEQIPDVFYGAHDSDGNLWASMLWGSPGFMTTPDETTLEIAPNVLAGDPAFDSLAENAEIGILGLMPHTRRRNRASGVVLARDRTSPSPSITVGIQQSFGNCPKYIQSRTTETAQARSGTVTNSDSLNDRHHEIISRADTFFVATHYTEQPAVGQGGVDVSHRGGKPGFVDVDDSGQITWPDFAGNRFFNTLGNLIRNPSAGLLFIDYADGDVLYLTGTAEILWHDESQSGFAGSERVIRYTPSRIVHATEASPWSWSEPEFSPFLDGTGSAWPS